MLNKKTRSAKNDYWNFGYTIYPVYSSKSKVPQTSKQIKTVHYQDKDEMNPSEVLYESNYRDPSFVSHSVNHNISQSFKNDLYQTQSVEFHVSVVESDSAEIELPEDAHLVRVIHAYTPQAEDEFLLVQGAYFYTLEQFDDGWAYGIDPNTHETGSFPLICVEFYDPSAKVSFSGHLDSALNRRFSSADSEVMNRTKLRYSEFINQL